MVNHPKRITKTYPDETFAVQARRVGATVKRLWEMRGPKNTAIAWISAYLVNNHVVLVQTYKYGNGWDVFTHGANLDINATVEDALTRCGIEAGAMI